MPYIPPNKRNKRRTTNSSFFDSVPDVLKAGYAQSIAGMAQQLAIGRRFDFGELSTAEKIGAGITSVILDAPAFILGGGIGGLSTKIVAKEALKQVGKKVIAKRIGVEVTKGASKTAAKRFVKNQVVQEFIAKDIKKRVGFAAIGSAGAFGVHAAISSPLSQQIATGEISPVQVGEDILRGATLGLAVGGVGGAAAKASGLTRVGAEIGTFTGVSAGLEGRLPTKEDLIHSTGFILGLKGVKAIQRGVGRKLRGQPFIQPSEPFKQIKKPTSVLEAEAKARQVELGLDKIDIGSKKFAERFPDVDRVMRTKYDVKNLSELSPRKKAQATAELFKKTFISDFTKVMADDKLSVRGDIKSGLIEDLIPKPLRDWVRKIGQSQDMVLGDSGKIIAEGLKKYQSINDIVYAGFIADAYGTKLPDGTGRVIRNLTGTFSVYNRLTKTWQNKKQLSEEMTILRRQGKFPALDKAFDKIWEKAQRVLPDIKDRRDDYIKRSYRKDIIENLTENFMTLPKPVLDKLAEGGKIKPGSTEHKELSKAIAESIPEWKSITPREFKNFDATELFKLVTKMNKGDLVKTTQMLMGQSMTRLFRSSSSLEKSLTFPELPKEFYENDIRVLIQRYASDVADRIAHATVFGSKGEIADALLKASEAENKGDFGIVSRIYNEATGLNNNNAVSRFSPTAKRVLDNMMALNVGFKIATGFATIPNLTQSFISSITARGVLPFIKGIGSLIRNPETAMPDGSTVPFREFIVRSGAADYNLAREFIGYSGVSGVSQKLATLMTKASGFEGVNKMNQFLAAATSFHATKSLHSRAQGGLGAKFAQDKLRSLGIDYKKPLTERQQLETMREFAINSQLQKNVLRDPMLLNDPNWRPMMLFKSFGLRQYQFIKDELKFDLSHGNFLPIIRLGALGYFGGMFVDKARHWLKELYAGEDVYKKEADGIEQYIEYIAQVGAFGVLGDMVSAENAMQSLIFFAKPVIISDAENVSKTMVALFRDMSTYGLMGAIARAPKGIAPLGGTAGRSAIRRQQFGIPFTDIEIPVRVMPRGQRKSSIENHRKFVLKQIRQNILEGKSTQAMKNLHSWNRANPRLPITLDDISHKKMYEFMLKKYEKRANP